MTYRYIDANPNLKNEIDQYVQEVVNKKVQEIARTAAEYVCKQYMDESFNHRVSIEVEKYEAERLEAAVAYTLKKYGIVARLTDSAEYETVKVFLDQYSQIFDKNPSTDEVYNLYCDDCEENEETPLHKKAFSR